MYCMIWIDAPIYLMVYVAGMQQWIVYNSLFRENMQMAMLNYLPYYYSLITVKVYVQNQPSGDQMNEPGLSHVDA